MKSLHSTTPLISACAAALMLSLSAMPLTLAQDAAAPELKTVKEKFSYALGLNLGRNFQRQDLDIDPVVLGRGIAAILEGTEPALTEEEVQAAFAAYEAEQMTLREAAAVKNKQDGEAFLAANAKKEGVKVTKSGLQYKVLQEGTGKSPTAADGFVAHYRGKFINGTVFDQSFDGDQPTPEDVPLSLGVSDVIPGWTEGLQLMKEGAKYQLFIPSAIAYGPMGRPGIPPNSTLVFELELLKVTN